MADDLSLRTIEAFRKLDQIEQVILTQGIKALADKRFTCEQFETWTRDVIQRHRAGEELRLDDLATPPPRPKPEP